MPKERMMVMMMVMAMVAVGGGWAGVAKFQMPAVTSRGT